MQANRFFRLAAVTYIPLKIDKTTHFPFYKKQVQKNLKAYWVRLVSHLCWKWLKVSCGHGHFITVKHHCVGLVSFFRLKQRVGKISCPTIKNTAKVSWDKVSSNCCGKIVALKYLSVTVQ